MNIEIEEVKNAYYDYVSKVSSGCKIISNELRKGNYENAFQSIANFAEGIEWLITVEAKLVEQGLTINSRIEEANEIMSDINSAIEEQDFTLVADLFEYELTSIFDSASEWIFIKQM